MGSFLKKSKITKNPKSEDNSKLKVPNQMTKSSKAQTNQRLENNCHIHDLVQAFCICRKWQIKSGFIAI